jgi:isopentenyl phosphate kinase
MKIKMTERYEFAGILEENKKFSKGKRTFRQLNKNQKHLFNLLLHGHGAYKQMPEEFKKLSKHEKNLITISWKKAQKVTNDLKVEVYNTVCDKVITAISTHFPKHEKFFNKLIYTKLEEPKIKNLKECGLTYDELITRFMREELLPSNFFSLK